MDCSIVRERLEAFALEELSPPDRDEVEAHVEGCPECREELEDIRLIIGVCRRALRHPLPVDRFDAVRAHLHAGRRSDTAAHLVRAWRRRFVGRGLAAAAAVILGLWLGPRPEEMAEPPEGVAELLRAIATPDGVLMDKVSADALTVLQRQAMTAFYLDWTLGQPPQQEPALPGPAPAAPLVQPQPQLEPSPLDDSMISLDDRCEYAWA